MEYRRILSIDGGGIKGVFPASFLATIESSIGQRIADSFDLIAGTSTGGIIALALGLGFSASDVLGFYESLGPAIFPSGRVARLWAAARGFAVSKYSSEPLRRALEDLLGDRRLGDSRCRLVIPSLNLETGEIYLFKTAHHPRLMRDFRTDAVSVALATSAAPTFFTRHLSQQGTPFVDGGVWANNPSAVAAIEAVSILGWRPDQIRMLSLGCTAQPLTASRARRRPVGLAYWGLNATPLVLTAQSSGADGMTRLLLGEEQVFRINPVVQPKRFDLDKLSEVPSLKGLGDSESRKALPRLGPVFFQEPVEPFVLYQSLVQLGD